MNKFEIGKSYTYKTPIYGDVVTCKVTRRTAKTVTIVGKSGRDFQLTLRVHEDSFDGEFLRFGDYRSAPILFAKNAA